MFSVPVVLFLTGRNSGPPLLPVAGRSQIRLDQPRRFGRHRHEADFVALALDAQVEDAFPLLEIADPQFAQFLPAQAVIEQGRQDRPVPLAF